MTVYDSLSGREIQNLPAPETMDGVHYDANLKRVYVTGGLGTGRPTHPLAGSTSTIRRTLITMKSPPGSRPGGFGHFSLRAAAQPPVCCLPRDQGSRGSNTGV